MTGAITAIRFAYKFSDIKEVRGNAWIGLSQVDFDRTPVHFAMQSGTANAKKLIKKI